MKRATFKIPKKVNYINIPFLNNGSVADIQTKTKTNKKLNKLLNALENSLIEDCQKFKMDDFFAKQSL